MYVNLNSLAAFLIKKIHFFFFNTWFLKKILLLYCECLCFGAALSIYKQLNLFAAND